MEVLIAFALLGLICLPPYWVGYRRGQRAGLPLQRETAGTYNEKHILAENLDWPVEISYTDASKKKSKRRVTVHRIYGREPQTPTYIEGYCHKRKQARTFRVDQICQLTNLSTGVIADNAQKEISGQLK